MSRPAALALQFALCSCVPAEREHEGRQPLGSASVQRVRRAPRVAVGKPLALPILTQPFMDDFERDVIGDDYHATGGSFRIERGRLCVKGARNHPLWLRHRLPRNARIQVEAEAGSGDGDIKLEAWGDGRAAASGTSYSDATGYLAILGGWKNRYHVLARLDEHGADRQATSIEPGSDDPRQQPVRPGHRYRLKLERTDGRTLRFWADDVELASMSDEAPLAGPQHEHFAFNAWEAPVCFDHLLVEPLPS